MLSERGVVEGDLVMYDDCKVCNLGEKGHFFCQKFFFFFFFTTVHFKLVS